MLSSIRRVAPERSVRKGHVQKLVLKGGWDNRKWNDRWLEISKTELHYCWKAGSIIDKIEANSVQCIKLLSQDHEAIEHRRSSENVGNGKHLPALTSIWPIILRHSRDHSEELRHGFFIQTVTGQHAGREYFFRTSTQDEASEWVDRIHAVMSEAATKPKSMFVTARDAARQLFDSNIYGVVTTLLISLNFAAYVYETQVQAYSP